GNVDAACPGDHVLDVIVNGMFVQGVDHRHLRRAAGGCDVLRHRVELLSRASHEKDLRSFTGEGPSHSAPDPSATTVDDRGLALEQFRHVRLLRVVADVLRGETLAPMETHRWCDEGPQEAGSASRGAPCAGGFSET